MGESDVQCKAVVKFTRLSILTDFSCFGEKEKLFNTLKIMAFHGPNFMPAGKSA
jgi:hypothetical protein